MAPKAVSPLSFRWDQEFIARVDAARGGMPRSAFVRAAVEGALAGGLVQPSPAAKVHSPEVRAAVVKVDEGGRHYRGPKRVPANFAAQQARSNKARGE